MKAAPRSSAARVVAPAATKPPSARGWHGDLRPYQAKRDFTLTPEPAAKSAVAEGSRFVVQQHRASHLHYDFRLELGGVLLSWAVPKGPSLSPDDKRLAVQTEDHPIDYRDFEGRIPQGQYGGGQVIVWDRGQWQPEADPRQGMQKGHLRFVLQGEKLHGAYSLVRTRSRSAKAQTGPGSSWLLLKHADEFARRGAAADVTHQLPRSVISGRLVEEIGDAAVAGSAVPKTAARAARKTPKKPAVARRAASRKTHTPALDSIELPLATLVDAAPAGGDWIYEIKFDGYRMLARINREQVQLRSRNGLDWSATFPGITQALQKIDCDSAIIDGEVCVLDEQGRSSFQRLQNVLPRGGGAVVETRRLVFQAFDLLWLDGVDLRSEPLVTRKQQLKMLLKKARRPLAYSEHLQADGRQALSQACAAGLEGLIAKRPQARYRGGRSRDWIKLKCQKRQEFTIVGMTAASGSRQGFGALLVAVAEGRGRKQQFRYAGRVGTGFSAEDLRTLKARLIKLKVDEPPVVNPPGSRGITWVRPELVCEVEYTERTDSGLLRHPSFQGLRLDKAAREVVNEKPLPLTALESELPDDIDAKITHADRVIDERSGVTKGELARYHQAVADWIMPYAESRPLSLVRCPQGNAQACFFQRHAMRGLGDSVRRRRVEGEELIYVDTPRGLIELVQFNTIELHGWGSRIDRIDRPDWIVMDLDPDTRLAFSAVVDAALEIREALARFKLKSFVKTTGGKGLHLVLPLRPQAGWPEIKAFARGLATVFAESEPERFVATASKAKRRGRIFIDYLRNEAGSTAVLPYSVRARPGATVAMPVDWKDLRKLDPQEFTVRSVPGWLKRRRHDPWAEFPAVDQVLPRHLPQTR